MSIVLLGIVLFYKFYKLVDMDNSGNSGDDCIDDFLAMKDSSSIARGDNPLDPESQLKSTTDPMDIFGSRQF